MRIFISILVLSCLGALVLPAAGIDGKWVTEFKMQGGKKAGGEEVTVKTTLELKSEGEALRGTVRNEVRGRERTVEISDGKIEGDRFSFTTTQRSRQGEVKLRWEGTVAGDELKGSRGREGARRSLPFIAKRAS